MAMNVVSGCVCCGISPCYNCKEKIYTCDYCGEEYQPEELYWDADGSMACEECLLSEFEKVGG